uniref:Glycosyltransferase n=1 Tax=Caldimicrobium thiodismutans TaxID=1653476 RepID=A0A832LWU8_9BACT
MSQEVENLIALALFFKFPEKGKVKTRLASSLGKRGATFIYKYLLKQTIKNLEKFKENARRESKLYLFGFYEGRISSVDLGVFAFKQKWLFLPQVGKNLGERLFSGTKLLFELGFEGVILLGADCPFIDVPYLNQALEALRFCPIVIGPALDGGYVLLGVRQDFRENLPLLFQGLPFETSYLLKETLSRLPEGSCILLPPLFDIDYPKDLLRWFWRKFKSGFFLSKA